ncbi:MAG: bacterial transcriptional activator domain-containing protein, partial [Anaerolineales bacterium]
KPEVTARRNLSRVASYIRNELPHPELLRINQESIGLNPEMVWSDAARFMELAEQSSPAQREEMATLYDGSFLSGFSLPGNSEFDFWLTSQQQQYEGRYLTALKGLIQIKFAVQDLSRAIPDPPLCGQWRSQCGATPVRGMYSHPGTRAGGGTAAGDLGCV